MAYTFSKSDKNFRVTAEDLYEFNAYLKGRLDNPRLLSKFKNEREYEDYMDDYQEKHQNRLSNFSDKEIYAVCELTDHKYYFATKVPEGTKVGDIITKGVRTNNDKAKVIELENNLTTAKSKASELNDKIACKSFSDREKVSAADLKKAQEEGVVQKKPNGKWGIISIQAKEWWNADYETKEKAENALKAYHANKGFSALAQGEMFHSWNTFKSYLDKIIDLNEGTPIRRKQKKLAARYAADEMNKLIDKYGGDIVINWIEDILKEDFNIRIFSTNDLREFSTGKNRYYISTIFDSTSGPNLQWTLFNGDTKSDAKQQFLEFCKNKGITVKKVKVAETKDEHEAQYKELKKAIQDKKFTNMKKHKFFSKITSEKEFREYAHNVMKQAHGDNYSEETTNKVVDDLIKDNPDADWGELIGRLTSGFGDKSFSKEPKWWNSRFAVNVLNAYDKGELTDSNIAQWEKNYNSGVTPNPSLGTKEILAYYKQGHDIRKDTKSFSSESPHKVVSNQLSVDVDPSIVTRESVQPGSLPAKNSDGMNFNWMPMKPFNMAIEPYVVANVLNGIPDGLYLGQLKSDKITIGSGETINLDIKFGTDEPLDVMALVRQTKVFVFKKSDLVGTLDNRQFSDQAEVDKVQKEIESVQAELLDAGQRSKQAKPDEYNELKAELGKKLEDLETKMRSFSIDSPLQYKFSLMPADKDYSMPYVIGSWMMAASVCHLFHICDTNYAGHMALDEFYNDFPEKIDALAEHYLADHADATFRLCVTPKNCPIDYLTRLVEFTKEYCSMNQGNISSEYQSQIDDIINFTKGILYKLKRLGEGKKVFKKVAPNPEHKVNYRSMEMPKEPQVKLDQGLAKRFSFSQKEFSEGQKYIAAIMPGYEDGNPFCDYQVMGPGDKARLDQEMKKLMDNVEKNRKFASQHGQRLLSPSRVGTFDTKNEAEDAGYQASRDWMDKHQD